MRTLIQFLFFMCCSVILHAQNAGINDDGSTADPSAMLHVESNNKGFIMPRMTSTERAAISNPATGLLVFDTSKRSLYMFDGVNWLALATASDEFSTITPFSDSSPYSFGSSIAIFNDKAVVGAYDHNSNKGAAYIYEKIGDEWQQIHTLTASDGATNDFFGISIALSGDYIAVGTYGVNKVYLYEWTTGFPERKILTPSDGVAGDNFGTSLAMATHYGTSTYELVLVGVPQADISANTDQGAAYLYSYDAGSNSATELKLSEATLGANASYGWSVDIDDDMFVIGAQSADVGANNNQGKAFVYTYVNPSTASLTNTFTASDGSSGDRFGWSVSIGRGTYYRRVAVGAPFDRIGNKLDQGSVYIYDESDSWGESKIIDPAGRSDDRFGESLSLNYNGEFILVGAPYANGYRGKILNFHRDTNLTPPSWVYDYEYKYPGAVVSDRFGELVAFHNGNQLIASVDFIGKIYFRTY